jgi:hypothetical protein
MGTMLFIPLRQDAGALYLQIPWLVCRTIGGCDIGDAIVCISDYPKTQSGWLWFFVLALPATFAGELAGDFIFRNRVVQAIEERSQSKSFSLLRVLDGFIAMLIAFGMAWGLALHFGADKV